MRGFGKKKFWILHTVLAITIVIGFIFAGGCADVSFGSQKFGDFGTSADEQKTVNCFIGKYGDPRTNSGPARFLEPVITTGLSNNVPVDTIMNLNKDTPKVYFWVFYDNFAKGDDLVLKWTYLASGKDVMTLHQQAGGDFGRAYAEFIKPDTGWPTGQHTISITGNGTSASVTIEVIDGATVTGTLPCQEGGQATPTRQTFEFNSGGTPRVITTTPNLRAGPTSSCTYTQIDQWGSEGTAGGQFKNPCGIAVDSAGNVYVTDPGNHRFQKFDSIIHVYGSDHGQFNSPCGIAIDSAGNIYIADQENDQIQKFSSDGKYLLKWGSKGKGDGEFDYPTGIAVDPAGNVYVTDVQNFRIQKFNANGKYLSQWGSWGTGAGEFYWPWGIAVDSAGNIYVTERDNNRVQKFDSDSKFITQWGYESGPPGWVGGYPGSGPGQFNTPTGIAADSAGNVYVADSNNNRIQKFDSTGRYLDEWGSSGTGAGQFIYPHGIAVDSAGNVYVADSGNHRIQKFFCTVTVQLHTTPTIVYACWTQPEVLTPTLIISLNPTPTTTTPPLAVHLPTTTPTIVYACWTQPQVLTPTLIISLNPTTTPTTVPTTPKVVILNTTPTTPIPKYKGYSI